MINLSKGSMGKKLKLIVMIPAYNEEKTIGKVINEIPRQISGIEKVEILVLDDGSSDKTTEIAKKAKVTVIEHYINRGLGGAIGTGFAYAKKNKFDCGNK